MLGFKKAVDVTEAVQESYACKFLVQEPCTQEPALSWRASQNSNLYCACAVQQHRGSIRIEAQPSGHA